MTTTVETTNALRPLLDRLKAVTGPDEELDVAITAWMHNASYKRYPPTDDFGPKNRWQFWSKDGAHFLGSEHKIKVQPLTASVDAALALVERVLPGQWKQILANAFIWLNHEDGTLPGLPLAILIALLTAMEAGR